MDTHVLNGAFYSLPYNVLNDLVPISPLVSSPAEIVLTPWLAEFIELYPDIKVEVIATHAMGLAPTGKMLAPA